jgi:4-hydroxy-2-oxoheptanedioate aldolase
VTYGLPPGLDQQGDPFQSALATIVEGCQRHGVVAGIHANAALAGARHKGGFRMITVGFDTMPVLQALRADEKAARAATTG